jgi:DNA-binding transcriptional regulator LsrR (DeoR family)
MLMMAARGVQQREIAVRFNVTQTTVSRRVTLALNRGELRRSTEVDRSFFDDATWREAERESAVPPPVQERLTKLATGRGAQHPVRVRVYPVEEAGGGVGDIEGPTRQLGHAVARDVLEMLVGGTRICGLSWGHTIGRVVDGIASLKPRPLGGGALTVVPLCGDPLARDADPSYSSSVLVQRLGDTLGLNVRTNLSLAMLPAFLPGDFAAREVDVVWKLIGKMQAYQTVFGGRETRSADTVATSRTADHYAARLDMVLTGISAAGSPLGGGRGPLFESGGLKEATFLNLVLADIGGVLIPRGPLRAGQKSTLSQVKARWTGLSEEELRGCAERAARAAGSHPPPGVVVVALGRNKAQPLLEAVERRWVNQLLVDPELAEELARRLPDIG